MQWKQFETMTPKQKGKQRRSKMLIIGTADSTHPGKLRKVPGRKQQGSRSWEQIAYSIVKMNPTKKVMGNAALHDNMSHPEDKMWSSGRNFYGKFLYCSVIRKTFITEWFLVCFSCCCCCLLEFVWYLFQINSKESKFSDYT